MAWSPREPPILIKKLKNSSWPGRKGPVWFLNCQEAARKPPRCESQAGVGRDKPTCWLPGAAQAALSLPVTHPGSSLSCSPAGLFLSWWPSSGHRVLPSHSALSWGQLKSLPLVPLLASGSDGQVPGALAGSTALKALGKVQRVAVHPSWPEESHKVPRLPRTSTACRHSGSRQQAPWGSKTAPASAASYSGTHPRGGGSIAGLQARSSKPTWV